METPKPEKDFISFQKPTLDVMHRRRDKHYSIIETKNEENMCLGLKVLIENSHFDARIIASVCKLWLSVACPFVEEQFAFNLNHAMYCSIYFVNYWRIHDLNSNFLLKALRNYASARNANIETFEYVISGSSHSFNFDIICGLQGKFKLKIRVKTWCQQIVITVPNNITSLEVYGRDLSLTIDGQLPSILNTLILNGSYNNLKLPPFPSHLCTVLISRSELNLGSSPNPLNILPPTVTILCVDRLWESLTVLPACLRILKITIDDGSKCDYPLDNFPPQLEHLELIGKLIHPISNLPTSLKSLKFTVMPTFSLCSLPNGLHTLHVEFQKPTLAYEPDKVTVLHENFNDILPPTLLVLGMREVHAVLPSSFFETLHDSLVELILPVNLNTAINHFPPALQRLQFGPKFNHPLDCLPENLRVLVFQGSERWMGSPIEFNHSLDFVPNSVVEIRFRGSSKFNQSLSNLPANLEVLQLLSFDEHILTKILLVSKRPQRFYPYHETFTSCFNHKLDNVPPSLRLLVLSKSYLYPLKFPPSVKVFVCEPRPPVKLNDKKFQRKYFKRKEKYKKQPTSSVGQPIFSWC